MLSAKNDIPGSLSKQSGFGVTNFVKDLCLKNFSSHLPVFTEPRRTCSIYFFHWYFFFSNITTDNIAYSCQPPSDLDKKPKASNGDSDAKGQSDGEKEHDGDITDNYEELGQGFEDMEQEDVTGTYGSELHLENEEDVYGYEYDNGEDEY